jgi:hypothetical protein
MVEVSKVHNFDAIDAADKQEDGKVDQKQSGYSRFSSSMLTVRYYIIRALGCPVPGLPAKFPIIGGRTFVELLLSLALLAIGAIATGGSGAIADYLCAATILLSMRYNILTFVFGLSFERGMVHL